MFKPQDIGQETVADGQPLIKVEFSSDGERMAWVLLIAGLVIAAFLYAIGATMSIAALSGIAFVIVLIALGAFLFTRSKAKAQAPDDDAVDEAVEKFKQDLVDTYNGYDVEYSADEILAAADEYRNDLMSNAPSGDVGDLESAADIAKLMGRDIIEARGRKKERRKAAKEAKQQEKARKKGR